MTYRWEPTTPLDRILEAGFKRMDEAVDGVIDKFSTVVTSKAIRICVICNKENPYLHQDFCIDLGCSGQLKSKTHIYFDNKLFAHEAYQ